MIFVTDAGGKCVHVSSDWHKLTGQSPIDAIDHGWIECIHPDDRSIVRETRDAATKRGVEYTLRYRLTRPDGSYRWVGAGGVPSFGISDNRFIGFLGSITELTEGAVDAIKAYGTVGTFTPPPPHTATLPSCSLDKVADYLLLAHSLIEGDGGKEALPDVRRALFKIGQALAKRSLEKARLN